MEPSVIAQENGARERGSIVTWSAHENWGFAQRHKDPRGRQVFVHVNAVDGAYRLDPGTPIEFNLIETAKGLRGLRVTPLASARRRRPDGHIQGRDSVDVEFDDLT